MRVRKGDIYIALLHGSTGSVQSGKRPVVITSNDKNNEYAPTVQVIPLTSKFNKKKLPVHVEVGWECGLTQPSLALAEQEQTIDKSMLIKKIGNCNKDVLLQIENAIRLQRDMAEPVNLPYIQHLARSIIVYNRVMKKLQLCAEDKVFYNTTVHEFKRYCNDYGIDYKKLLYNILQNNEGGETQCLQKKTGSLRY